MGKSGWLIFALVILPSLTSWAGESLVQRLVSDDKLIWRAAFEELDRLDENSKRTCVPLLLQHVREGSGQYAREHAIGALSRMGSVVVAETMPLLEDADPAVRGAAVRILGGAAMHGHRDSAVMDPIVSSLKKLLHDPDRHVRLQTVVTLGQIGAIDAIPDLIETLKDNDSSVRRYSVTAIAGIDLRVKQVVPVLAEQLKDKDKSVRVMAAMTLSTLSDEVSASVQQVIPQLLQALQDSEADVRAGAARTLARFCGPENQDIVPSLILALKKTNNKFERIAIVQALEKIGSSEALEAANPYKEERNLLMRELLSR